MEISISDVFKMVFVIISTFVMMVFAIFVFQLHQLSNFETDINTRLQNKGYISNADYVDLMHISLTRYGGLFTLSNKSYNAYIPTSYGQKISYNVDIHLQNSFVRKALNMFGASDNHQITYTDTYSHRRYTIDSYFDTSTNVTTTSMNNDMSQTITTKDLDLTLPALRKQHGVYDSVGERIVDDGDSDAVKDGTITSAEIPQYQKLSSYFGTSLFENVTLSTPAVVSQGTEYVTMAIQLPNNINQITDHLSGAFLYYDENNRLIASNFNTIYLDGVDPDSDHFFKLSQYRIPTDKAKYVRFAVLDKPDDFKFVVTTTQDGLYWNQEDTKLQN